MATHAAQLRDRKRKPVAFRSARSMVAEPAALVNTNDLTFAAPVFRTILPMTLIGLTVALLAYPRQMSLNYSAIQSVDAVKPLPIFASLYYAWIMVLVALLLRRKASVWQGVALIAVFVTVYLGFWDIPFAAVKHPDSILNATTAEYVRASASIPFGHANITYTDFPGLHTFTGALAIVANLTMPAAVTAVTLTMDLLRAGILFTICLRLLGDPRWAGIAALLAMQGNIVLARLPFYPGSLGLVFAPVFLLIALRGRQALFAHVSDILPAIVLLAASTITHFVTSILLVFLLVGMQLVTYGRRSLRESLIRSALLPLASAIVLIAWLIYATLQTFDDLVLVLVTFSENLRWGQFLREFLIVGRSNFGTQVPLWATTLKLFWLFLLFGAGTTAVLPWLRRLKSLRLVEARALGALLGILFLSLVATLFSLGGSEFLRYAMYGPLVTAPFLLLSIRRLPRVQRRLGLSAMVASLVVLAVPTFLVHYPTVRMDMFYDYEVAPARILNRLGHSANLRITAPANGYVPYVGYLPNAEYSSTPIQSVLKDQNGVWVHLNDQVDIFMEGSGAASLYVRSMRPRIFYRYNFGIPLDDRRWDALQERLEGEAAVYDNGFVALYASTTQVANRTERGGH